jgi:hypothetical protein
MTVFRALLLTLAATRIGIGRAPLPRSFPRKREPIWLLPLCKN